MALVTELELPELDYFDPELRGERFHATMRDLAGSSWLATSPLGFFALDRESVSFFLRSRETTFPGQKVAEVFGVVDGRLREQIDRNILHVDGADHARLRQLVNPAFTPRAADRWRPVMRDYVERLFSGFAAAGRCEVVADLAVPYPAMTIATVMGAPLEDAGRLGEWSNWIQRQFSADMLEHRDRIGQACAELYEYLEGLVAAKRAAPADDLMSALIAAESEGDRLSDVELVNLVLNVLVGGVDTTQSQLAQALRLFAGHPEQWALLAQRPELAPAAVDEVIRYEPITPFTARITLSDLDYRGVTFPAGTVVMCSAFTANRDPDTYERPDEFDITADRGSAKPFTFGAGIHYCLGANLARAELQEALAFLAPRMPGLALEAEPRLGSVNGIYGIDELRVRFGSASS